jgi:short chain dehydrogenase
MTSNSVRSPSNDGTNYSGCILRSRIGPGRDCNLPRGPNREDPDVRLACTLFAFSCGPGRNIVRWYRLPLAWGVFRATQRNDRVCIECAWDEDMKGKVVVITGATSGIGQAAAENLASMGARIVPVARDHERGQEALKRLRERTPDVAHSIYYADLSRISETKRVAAEIVEAEPRIDVLVNNAGAMFGSRQLTADGLAT